MNIIGLYHAYSSVIPLGIQWFVKVAVVYVDTWYTTHHLNTIHIWYCPYFCVSLNIIHLEQHTTRCWTFIGRGRKCWINCLISGISCVNYIYVVSYWALWILKEQLWTKPLGEITSGWTLEEDQNPVLITNQLGYVIVIQ